MAGKSHSYAGRVLGPAINLLPEDCGSLPEIVPVEWLNTTCAMYRLDVLPRPAFASHFTGYSLMEDLTLSLEVARRWRLVNARTARIFHDSQNGSHKSNVTDLSAMELINRHYVMVYVLHRSTAVDYLKLLVWEMFLLAVAVRSKPSLEYVGKTIRGKLRASRHLAIANRRRAASAVERASEGPGL